MGWDGMGIRLCLPGYYCTLGQASYVTVCPAPPRPTPDFATPNHPPFFLHDRAALGSRS